METILEISMMCAFCLGFTVLIIHQINAGKSTAAERLTAISMAAGLAVGIVWKVLQSEYRLAVLYGLGFSLSSAAILLLYKINTGKENDKDE